MKFRILSVLLMAGALGACVSDDGAYYDSGYYASRPVVVQERYYRDYNRPQYTPAQVYHRDRYAPPPPRYPQRDWRHDDRRNPNWRGDNRNDWRNNNARPPHSRDDNRRPGRPDWREEGRRPDQRPDRPGQRPDRRPNRPDQAERPNNAPVVRPSKGGGFNLTPLPNRNDRPQTQRRAPQEDPAVIMAPDARRR